MADRLPAGLLDAAKAAFVAGLNSASAFSALAVAGLAVLAALTLRHVGHPRPGEARSQDREGSPG